MDDLEFIQNCVNLGRQCWDEFLNRYSRLIYGCIYGVIRIKGLNKNEVSVEDLFQEFIVFLFEDNFKKLRSFKAKNNCSLASWLRHLTVNFTLDHIRGIKPIFVSFDEKAESGYLLDKTFAVRAGLPQDLALERERLVFLTDCIRKLELEDKYFLELNMNSGLKPDELTEYFRVSRGAIDMRKSRILKLLRECFRQKGILLSPED
jgi:RNA polymerase sigma factor (sigma-70 family)